MATKKTVEASVETAEVNSTEQVSSVMNETVSEPSETETAEQKETSFTKKQIVESKQYKAYIDVLNTILGDRKYTITEVNNLLKEFLSKEVE